MAGVACANLRPRHFLKPNLVSVSAISQNKELLRDDERMPVICPTRQIFLFRRTGG
jgi:hypothetical protein